MYAALLTAHSLFRWLVLLSLAVSLYRAATGRAAGRPFFRADNALRHWTATITHLQLIIGILLYIKSPVAAYFRSQYRGGYDESVFFGLVHLVLMLVAVVLVTVGSALAKRRAGAGAKYETILRWFGLALLLILIAIPWPFSPLAGRPYFRTF